MDMRHPRASERLATELLNTMHTGAIPMLKARGAYRAHSGNDWTMSTEKSKGELTGRIVLTCAYLTVLTDFAQRARAAGHVIQWEREYTVLITPKL